MDFFLPVTHCEAAPQGVRDIARAIPESQRNGSNTGVTTQYNTVLCFLTRIKRV